MTGSSTLGVSSQFCDHARPRYSVMVWPSLYGKRSRLNGRAGSLDHYTGDAFEYGVTELALMGRLMQIG